MFNVLLNPCYLCDDHLVLREMLMTLFLSHRQAYGNCVVLEARICYNVAKLMSLNAER